MEGLEPTHLAALDPKSSVSTNFTTSALLFSDTIVFQAYFKPFSNKWSAKISNYFCFFKEKREIMRKKIRVILFWNIIC